ncbi:uncharacterized protein LOC131691892 [Topomyia yanbarensis]|uniref:uncharacterized protein LOC131691892 n=1 Tax=Topomyia yanbarensis TaxID=2498891 RepID=UPI00273C68B4|nr:uncharacterized protein LOC131691892 [Topomyia yanbarensis]XP_058834616.1 uncharacterized protein LOC131691892 [Topomyia yanbarensis]
MVDITVLPPEIISKIFEFLRHEDRLAAACVCKQWLDLAFSPKFCRRLCLQLNTNSKFTALRSSIFWRRCRKVTLRCDEIDNENLQIIIDFLKNAPLEWFHIDGDSVVVKELLGSDMQHMTHLSLYLHYNAGHGSEADFNINFNSVKYLNLRAPIGRYLSLNVNCPNLIAVNMVVVNDECVPVITSLRTQLQGLEISAPSSVFLKQLAKETFENLTTLSLWVAPHGNDIEQVLEKVPHLEDLCLNVGYTDTSVGACFTVLKHLKRLTLIGMTIDIVAFFGTLNSIKRLQMLSLERCNFTTEETNQASSIASESVTNFRLSNECDHYVMPSFPNLEELAFLYSCQPTVDVLGVICQQYPKLIKLNFGGNPGLISMFHTETSIINFKKLRHLKSVQFSRMSLENYDWITCGELKIQKLRLVGCMIDGTGALQIVQTFTGLREFFIDNSYLRQPSEVFDIDEGCTKGLRTYLPHCRVSYYDCHIEAPYNMCGGRKHPSGGLTL